MKRSFWNPFRFRRMAGAALVIGVLVGIWLGDLFKGFGWGPGDSQSVVTSKSDQPPEENIPSESTSNEDQAADLVGYHATEPASTPEEPIVQGIVKVLIDGRSYFLRMASKKQEISLEDLVLLIAKTPPDDDGLRVIIDRTETSRVSAEDNLFEALKRAGISTNEIKLQDVPVDLPGE